jgi:hypothetical protein
LAASTDLEEIVLADREKIGRHSHSIWTIFFDGVDESLAQPAQIEKVIPRLLRNLAQQLSFDQIRVRISCRSAEWPQSLEAELRTIWSGGTLRVYELGQLRRSDVVVAANRHGTPVTAARFLGQVAKHEAELLASRPVTLKMLLNLFEKNAELPVRQAQLYRQGLLASIEEGNISRRETRQTWRLDPGSKLMVAARIAAANMFSDRAEIWTGLLSESPPTGSITLSEIAGGYEPALGSMFPVGEADLREVLLTSLFTRVKQEVFVWSHKTFPEFLTAHYLVEHGLNAEQAIDFLGGASGRGNIPPQLHEVTAWLAGMHPDFFRAVVTSQPDILLRSDIASAAPEDREALIRELLLQFDNHQIHDFDYERRRRYDRLHHARLAEQLAPYIKAKQKGLVVRRVAIDIAEANFVRELAALFADIALDTSDHVHIRAQSAAALSKIGVAEATSRLIPLIASDPSDVDDELRGYALQALWPQFISLAELLKSLSGNIKRDYRVFGA